MARRVASFLRVRRPPEVPGVLVMPAIVRTPPPASLPPFHRDRSSSASRSVEFRVEIGPLPLSHRRRPSLVHLSSHMLVSNI